MSVEAIFYLVLWEEEFHRWNLGRGKEKPKGSGARALWANSMDCCLLTAEHVIVTDV